MKFEAKVLDKRGPDVTKTGSHKHAFKIALPDGEEKWASAFIDPERPRDLDEVASKADVGEAYEFDIYQTKSGFWNVGGMVPIRDVREDTREEQGAPQNTWEAESSKKKSPPPKPRTAPRTPEGRDILIIRQVAVKAAAQLVNINMPDIELKSAVNATIKAAQRFEKYVIEGK